MDKEHFITGDRLMWEILKAMNAEHLKGLQRIVIDISLREPVRIYTQNIGGGRLLDIDWVSFLQDAAIDTEASE